MTRFLPKTLAGQLIALLLLALVAAQALSFWFFYDERRHAVRAAARGHVFSRTAAIVRLIAETPQRLHEQILETASTPRLRFWISDQPVARRGDDDGRAAVLARRLRDELPHTVSNVIVEVEESGTFLDGPRRHRRIDAHRRHHRPPPHDRLHRWEPERGSRLRRRLDLVASVQLADRNWLNAQTILPATPPVIWAFPSLAAMAAMALALIVIVVVMVRRITRPMELLADAADRLGRGEPVDSLPAKGPSEIRRSTRAFDRMRERLQRFVRDRTQMLAAISHDLRTPLTTLRLRVEFVDDPSIKGKLLATIDEMNVMVEALLAFVREDAAREDTRTVDLAALVESVCADFVDAGNDVSFNASEGAMPLACRPVALKRAFRNVIENAVHYGQRARTTLSKGASTHTVTVDDDGPGVPDADLARVFEPFVRIDASRSADGGGIGLGLSIVRSIVRGHGGDVVLSNRTEGGLRVTVTLPIE